MGVVVGVNASQPNFDNNYIKEMSESRVSLLLLPLGLGDGEVEDDLRRKLHLSLYLVSLIIWIYTMLQLLTIDVSMYQVKMLKFYNDRTTKVTFVGRKMRYTVQIYSIVCFQIISDTEIQYLGLLHTRAESRNREIVRAQKKVSKGHPKTPP